MREGREWEEVYCLVFIFWVYVMDVNSLERGMVFVFLYGIRRSVGIVWFEEDLMVYGISKVL